MFEVGATRSWERTFSDDDVRRFGELTGDRGEQHVVPGPDGRLMVQGLLTATLPTDDGGRPKGFAFVDVPEDDQAAQAISAMNGKELDGRELVVNEARPRVERSGGGGGRSCRG